MNCRQKTFPRAMQGHHQQYLRNKYQLTCVSHIFMEFGLILTIYVMVDGCRSKLVDVVSGVPQGGVLARYCSSLTLQCFFTFWKIS